MKKIVGKYNTANVMTDNIEDTAVQQIKELVDQEFTQGEQITIMPDVHAGKGSTVGTTMTLNHNRVVPNLVGVDIGCGMRVVKLADNDQVDFKKLDQVIHEFVPAGFNVHETPVNGQNLSELLTPIGDDNQSRIQNSVGTLGGGNHFIELDKDDAGSYYLVIHSGSRSLGVKVANWYQSQAIRSLSRNALNRQSVIDELKMQGRADQIEQALANVQSPTFNPILAYVEGSLYSDYLNDMKITQRYAYENRLTMAEIIIKHMGWNPVDSFDSIHNYIDIEHEILRKGATEATEGTRLVIPMNMGFGSLICTGLGSSDWNQSAPHGAGRTMSRKTAFENLSLDQYESQMNGIYSTSVVQGTLDEAPKAYKPAQEIIDNIQDKTVHIDMIIKPVYSFKAV